MKIIASSVGFEAKNSLSQARIDVTQVSSIESARESTSARIENMSKQEQSNNYQYESTSTVRYRSTSIIGKNEQSQLLQQNKLLQAATSVSLQQEAIQISSTPLGNAQLTLSSDMNLRIDRYRFVSSSQSQTTVTRGYIDTADGRSIGFELLLDLQRRDQYESKESFVIEAAAMQDPLVLNFAAETVTLTDRFFEFDLKPGGNKERIATLGSGSGYLVFDRNGNGVVDDGSELFGPSTGSGFAELSVFDLDGNSWVDENDPIFDQLQVWVQSGDERELKSLREVGVGAIYLGSASNNFDLVSTNGMVLGNIKASGLMLMENGEARTVQEIDVANFAPDQNVAAQNTNTSSSARRQETPDVADRISNITQAISRLADIRKSQQQYIDGLQSSQERAPSLLEKLLEEMENLRIEQLEKAKIQSAKERLESLYGREM